MWFGTKEYADWIPTPLSGANVSPEAWGDSGTFLNGGGYGIHSYNSHKTYDFAWSKTSSREAAQLIKSYFEGTYGRGKLYFHDPLTYTTNVLPARWAAPSITVGFEGPSLIEGVEPRAVNTSGFRKNKLPIKSAQYNLVGVPPAGFTTQEVARNYFTNPRLNTTSRETARNLFTNPSFERGLPSAEIGVNLLPSPLPTENWGHEVMYDGAGDIVEDSGISELGGFPTYSVSVTEAGGSLVSITAHFKGSDSFGARVEEGKSYEIYAEVSCSGGAINAVTPNYVDSSGDIIFDGLQVVSTISNISPDPSQPTPIRFTVQTPEEAFGMIPKLVLFEVGVGEAHMTITKVRVSPVEYASSEWYDGSHPTPGNNSRWVGDENDSVSELTTRVAVEGMTQRSGRVERSTDWAFERTHSLALSQVGSASPNVNLTPNTDYTVIARCFVPEGYSFDEDDSGSRALVVQGESGPPEVVQTPEEVGSHELRLQFRTGTGSTTLELTGSADFDQTVYWDLLTIVKGVYSGVPFSGSTINSVPHTYSWAGAANASPSIRTSSNAPRGITGGEVVDHWLVVSDGNVATVSRGSSQRRFHITARYADQEVNGVVVDEGENWLTAPSTITLGPGEWRQPGLFASTYQDEYFMGDTPNTSEVVYTWAGTPERSESIKSVLIFTGTDTIPEDTALFIPIPSGMDLHMGAFYETETGGGVYAAYVDEDGVATDQFSILTPLDNNSSNLFPDVFSKGPNTSGIYLWLGHNGTSVTPSLTVAAIHARLTPSGKQPQGEKYWIGGQGHIGVRFAEPPSYVNHTGVNGGQVETGAVFIESEI